MATSMPLGKTGRCVSRAQVLNPPVQLAQQARDHLAPRRLWRDKISTAVFPTGPRALKRKVGCGARSQNKNFRGLTRSQTNRFQLTCASLGKWARARLALLNHSPTPRLVQAGPLVKHLARRTRAADLKFSLTRARRLDLYSASTLMSALRPVPCGQATADCSCRSTPRELRG